MLGMLHVVLNPRLCPSKCFGRSDSIKRTHVVILGFRGRAGGELERQYTGDSYKNHLCQDSISPATYKPFKRQ